MRRMLVLTIMCSLSIAVAAQEPLTEAQVEEAVALGKGCGDVPLVKVGAGGGDFTVFNRTKMKHR
jgi:hypothetical protein